MPYEIVMPQLGLTMTEGAVTSWLKRPGEWVQKGDILFTVETDKVEMEVESYGSGYLSETLVGTETVVPVGTLLATLSDSVQQPAAVGPTAAASPRARRVAQELGVDLSTVAGHGSRITEDDVRRHFASSGAAAAPPRPEAALSAARKVTARRMTESFQSAPHFYLGVEASAAGLVSLRESLNAPSRAATKITYTDFFLKALAGAIAKHPEVNGFWRDQAVVRRDSIDICCAVQAGQSLVAPVIRNADRLDLMGIAERRAELVHKARSGSLSVADLEGGSATLSNLGSTGVDWFQAILNPPQSVILAVGRIVQRPVVVGDQIQAQPTVHLNLSVDHRVLDGAAAATFLVRIQQLLERPDSLMA